MAASAFAPPVVERLAHLRHATVGEPPAPSHREQRHHAVVRGRVGIERHARVRLEGYQDGAQAEHEAVGLEGDGGVEGLAMGATFEVFAQG